MAVVIADGSSLIALAKINQLELLHRLFSIVLMTDAIADECLRRSSTEAERIASALQAAWLQRVDNPILKHQLSRSLGLECVLKVKNQLSSRCQNPSCLTKTFC